MSRLGISSSLFTVVRAILAVTVFIMIAYVRSRIKATIATGSIAIEEEQGQEKVAIARSHSPFTAMAVENHSPSTVAIPEQSSRAHSLEDIIAHSHSEDSHSPSTVAIEDSPSNGYVAIEEATDTHQSLAIIASGSQGYRDKIKATWLRHIQEGREIKLTDIAQDAEVGYSTVKKWASSIREEVESNQD